MREEISENFKLMNLEDYKFLIFILYFIIKKISELNKLFQSDSCMLHLIYPEITRLMLFFAEFAYNSTTVDNLKQNYETLVTYNYEIIQNQIKFEDYLIVLNNYIDFNRPIHEAFFFIATEKVDSKIFKSSRMIFQKAISLLKQYCKISNNIIKSFQLLDLRNKFKIKFANYWFREYLLKRFINLYKSDEYDTILTSYQNLTESEILKTDEYLDSNKNLDVETYWINFSLSNEKYSLLAGFFKSICTIPHSNTFIERMYSLVKYVKSFLSF